ncbi:outer membrane lipoprotein-sorting protein [Halobacteriovorax sp. HFRX-2_2]|uniref:outer membrane lipoprotein-sorting protein n=1 Tax=unclassified Halobacteriovorax TaxID=2639665 RepID=UPI00371EAF34
MKIVKLLLMLLTLSVFANDKGLEIARKMDQANKGYIGDTSTMELVLVDSSGVEIIREMLGASGEFDGVDKSLMEFKKPLDVKGTKLLTWTWKNEKDDDQWLYLPSLKRVKKINSRSKGSSFMGSEFSFEDIGGQTIEKYNYKYLKDDKVAGQKVWVLERVAKAKSSYSKVVLYVSQKYLAPVKSEYYNKRNEHIKTSTMDDFKSYTVGKRKMWRANKILMLNLNNKKQSIFKWKNRVIGKAVNENDLTKRKLK